MLSMVFLSSSSTACIWPRQFSKSGLFLDIISSKYLWDWTEMITVSFSLRAKTVLIPHCLNTERCRREGGGDLYPLECRLSSGKTFRQKPQKCCQLETQASWSYLLQSTFVFVFRIRLLLYKNMLLRALIPNICVFGYQFENEGVWDKSDSVCQFLARYGCIKCVKIKRLDTCYTVESWRFKMF